MTLSGLQEAGLSDWPSWYRNLNPGYFADDNQYLRWRGRAHGRGDTENGCSEGNHLGLGVRKCQGWKSASVIGKREMEAGEKVLKRLRDLPKV
jgi:hypothetical protein